jgi:hypothetical protein
MLHSMPIPQLWPSEPHLSSSTCTSISARPSGDTRPRMGEMPTPSGTLSTWYTATFFPPLTMGMERSAGNPTAKTPRSNLHTVMKNQLTGGKDQNRIPMESIYIIYIYWFIIIFPIKSPCGCYLYPFFTGVVKCPIEASHTYFEYHIHQPSKRDDRNLPNRTCTNSWLRKL